MMGCVDAEEYDPHHVEAEPFDRQLVSRKRKYLLKIVYFSGKIFLYMFDLENGVHDKIRLFMEIDERKEYDKNSIKNGSRA